MATSLPFPIHTIAEVSAQIDQSEDPWFVLGCFLHDWWCYARDHRQELICEPFLPATTSEGKHWVAFCAATVEELYLRTAFPFPDWLSQDTSILDVPWFVSSPTSQQETLLSTTPEPFRRRNVFVSGSVLDNKYELRHTFGAKPRWSLWSDQDLQKLSEAKKVSPHETA
jgi:hypothetical protein